MVLKTYKKLYFFVEDSQATYITEDSDEQMTMDFKDMMGMNDYQKINMCIFVGYEKTLDELKQFKADYNTWCEEIHSKHCFTIKNKRGQEKKFRIQMENYKSIQHATYQLFKNFCPIKDIKSTLEPMEATEYLIHQQCLRSGLITMNNDYRETTQQIYGYDFSSEYPNFLCNLVFPRKTGTKIILKEINWDKIQYGIYRVHIQCVNKEFMKLFNFSKNNHYTNRQLKDLYKLKDTYSIQFELLEPDDDYSYNAYVYESDFIDGEEMFKEWLDNMTKVKTKCDKSNQLIKMLITSLWGLLCETKKIRIDATDEHALEEYDLEDEYYYKERVNNEHVIIKLDDIHTYGGFGRMKVFLTTNCRQFMMNYIIKNKCVDNVVRIHTDGIMLNKKWYFSEKLNKHVVPQPENKSTGMIKIYNPMRYFHVCQCGFEYKYKDKKEHMKTIKSYHTFITCKCGFEYLNEK